MLMTKRHIRTRSSDQHRLLLLTEVKTKEYRNSECMENINCTEISKQITLQLYVFCLSTKEKQKSLHENK